MYELTLSTPRNYYNFWPSRIWLIYYHSLIPTTIRICVFETHTEKYRFSNIIEHLPNNLCRSLGDKGAVVKAFDSEIAVANNELSERFDQEFTRNIIISIEDRMEKPGLLILNSDIKSFDTEKNSWLYISFREYLDDFGNLKIYNVQELFDTIKNAIVKEENLFDKARQHLRKEKAISAHKIVELKPGAFGISLDLKETFNFFKQLRDK